MKSPLVVRFHSALCILAVALSSCAKEPTRIEYELTADQRRTRQSLLQDALDVEKLAGQNNFEVDEFVGRDASEYAELFQLADTVLTMVEYNEYRFNLEGVSKNVEGWGTLALRVTDGRITHARVVYPEW